MTIDFRKTITAALARPAARDSVFSPELSYGRHQMPALPTARRAAVVLLLFLDGPTWKVPLIARPASLSLHAGQIGLPGGALEPNETPQQAACRELHEELGVQVPAQTLLGELSEVYVFASNFRVQPFVAVLDQRPAFVPSPDEVANLLEPSLVELHSPERRESIAIERHGVRFTAPAINYRGQFIWGATSVILEEFMSRLVGELGPEASAWFERQQDE